MVRRTEKIYEPLERSSHRRSEPAVEKEHSGKKKKLVVSPRPRAEVLTGLKSPRAHTLPLMMQATIINRAKRSMKKLEHQIALSKARASGHRAQVGGIST